jgi:hypothetical protein
MKTVISASRRTDIPAFYLDWFIKAVRHGSMRVQNPLYKSNYFEVDLRPEKVEWIIFWSRNYKRFLDQRQYFSDYNLFFHFTILSHHELLEKSQQPINQSIKQVEKLATHYDPRCIIWRYDPIVIWQKASQVDTNYSASEYEYLCYQMSTLNIRKCYFSFVSLYRKFQRHFKNRFPGQVLNNPHSPAARTILCGMKEIAMKHGIELYSCCNDGLVDAYIKKGRCISGERLNGLNTNARVSQAKAPTRKDCGCTRSIDIGDYAKQPCYYGCIYCYANPVIYPNTLPNLRAGPGGPADHRYASV